MEKNYYLIIVEAGSARIFSACELTGKRNNLSILMLKKEVCITRGLMLASLKKVLKTLIIFSNPIQ